MRVWASLGRLLTPVFLLTLVAQSFSFSGPQAFAQSTPKPTASDQPGPVTPFMPSLGYHPRGDKTLYLNLNPIGGKKGAAKYNAWLFDPKATDSLGVGQFLGVEPGRKTIHFPTPVPLSIPATQFQTLLPQDVPPLHALDIRELRETEGNFSLWLETAHRVDVPTVQKFPLTTSAYVYWEAMVPLLHSLYLHRSGVRLDDPSSGIRHAPGHTNDALTWEPNLKQWRKADERVGGWYTDANYGKSTSDAALIVSQLLTLYELNPKANRTIKLNYSLLDSVEGSLPDLLHEAKWGAQWLLRMQRSDGAFYHGIVSWPEPHGWTASKKRVYQRPEDDDHARYTLEPSSQATALAAASLAQLAIPIRKYNTSFALKCRLAAEKAWLWLEMHPDRVVSETPFDVNGQALPSLPHTAGPTSADATYRFLAGVQLLRKLPLDSQDTTQQPLQPRICAAVQSLAQEVPPAHFSWENPGLLGFWQLAKNSNTCAVSALSPWRAWLQNQTQELTQTIHQHPFGYSLTSIPRDSLVGHTQQLLTLAVGAALTPPAPVLTETPDKDTPAPEVPQPTMMLSKGIHFLYGFNPRHQHFVTEALETPNRIEHHHRIEHPAYPLAQVMGKPIPGMLVSGPYPLAADGRTPIDQRLASYTDHTNALDSNTPQLLPSVTLALVLGWLNGALVPPPPVDAGTPQNPTHYYRNPVTSPWFK